MNHPKQQSQQSDLSGNESTTPTGFGIMIGSVLKPILTSGIGLIGSGSMLLLLAMIVSIVFAPDEQQYDIKMNDLETGDTIELTQKAPDDYPKLIFQAIDDFCINVSVALIAAGLVTVTVERSSKKQREGQYQNLLKTVEAEIRDKLEAIERKTLSNIEELTTASQDYMISSLIYHENIFNQVKNHILRQDIILKKYQVRVSLEWYDIPDIREKQKLLEKVHIEYSICNISSIVKYYNVRNYVPNDSNFSVFMPHIIKYTVDGVDNLKGDLVIDLQQQRQEEKQNIGFEQEIEIQPNSEALVVIEFNTARDANGHEMFVSPHIAENMELQVTNHPKELELSCEPYHPGDSIDQPSEGNVVNLTWRINHGLLPYQGFNLFWKPKSTM